MANEKLTIALSKGRIFEETMPLLKVAGIEPLENPESSRKLILETTNPNVNFVMIRASDVPTYVQYGAADLGVVGKDVLMEHGGEGVYEMVDLEIAKCRLMTAGPVNFQANPHKRLKIATKFTNCAKRYFASKGQQVEMIKLYGSMELAPIVGLADLIVDVVDTGNTLKANGLIPMENIAEISSRLIVNNASLKIKNQAIKTLVNTIREAVQA
jgi:ATP phosphoribosyltransferase